MAPVFESILKNLSGSSSDPSMVVLVEMIEKMNRSSELASRSPADARATTNPYGDRSETVMFLVLRWWGRVWLVCVGWSSSVGGG